MPPDALWDRIEAASDVMPPPKPSRRESWWSYWALTLAMLLMVGAYRFFPSQTDALPGAPQPVVSKPNGTPLGSDAVLAAQQEVKETFVKTSPDGAAQSGDILRNAPSELLLVENTASTESRFRSSTLDLNAKAEALADSRIGKKGAVDRTSAGSTELSDVQSPSDGPADLVQNQNSLPNAALRISTPMKSSRTDRLGSVWGEETTAKAVADAAELPIPERPMAILHTDAHDGVGNLKAERLSRAGAPFRSVLPTLLPLPEFVSTPLASATQPYLNLPLSSDAAAATRGRQLSLVKPMWTRSVRMYGGTLATTRVLRAKQSEPSAYRRQRDTLEAWQPDVVAGFAYEQTHLTGLRIRVGLGYQAYHREAQLLGSVIRERTTRTVIDPTTDQVIRVDTVGRDYRVKSTRQNRLQTMAVSLGAGYALPTTGRWKPYVLAEAGYEFRLASRGGLLDASGKVVELDNAGVEWVNPRPGLRYSGVLGVDVVLTPRWSVGLSGRCVRFGELAGADDPLSVRGYSVGATVGATLSW